MLSFAGAEPHIKRCRQPLRTNELFSSGWPRWYFPTVSGCFLYQRLRAITTTIALRTGPCHVHFCLPSGHGVRHRPISVSCTKYVHDQRWHGQAVAKRVHIWVRLCDTCQMFGGDRRRAGRLVCSGKSCVSANRRPCHHKRSGRFECMTPRTLGNSH